jgi:hypothetical protein
MYFRESNLINKLTQTSSWYWRSKGSFLLCLGMAAKQGMSQVSHLALLLMRINSKSYVKVVPVCNDPFFKNKK